MKAFRITGDSSTFLALGCPGGRVRILRAGTPGQTNSIGTLLASSEDFGTGGMAMCVKEQGSFVDIFFGTLAHHIPRGAYPATALGSAEVMSGNITWLRWPGQGGQSTIDVVIQMDLQPSFAPSGDRGGFGVAGMAIGDLLPDFGDELVVTTLAGDLFVFNLLTPTPLHRSWVPGGLGLYNSIVITDLDPNAMGPELYIGSSLGVRKWRRP